MPHLIVHTPSGESQVISITKPLFRIGKRQTNDLVLNLAAISRDHCEIAASNGQWVLRDLNSRNGTYVNGQRITSDFLLADGMQIQLGEYVLVFREDAATATPPSPADQPSAAPAEGAGPPARRPSAEVERSDGRRYTPVKLKKKVHAELLKAFDLKNVDFSKHSEQEIRQRTTEIVVKVIQSLAAEVPSWLTVEQLTKEIVDEALGLGPIEDLLRDEEVDEIMVNGWNHIYVEKHGRLDLTDKRFTDNHAVLQTIRRIIAPIGRRIDESTPMVDARLPDGSRVNAIIPPLALTGPTLTIRKFSTNPFTIDDLIGFGTLTREIAEFLHIAVQYRRNIVISGGTGSGKTTLLNVVSSFIPHGERIITIEDAAELKLPQEHVVSLEAKPPNIEGKGEIPIRKLVINSLRMRPDRIVVGECRGGEALDMLQAMNTGHDGSLTTLHANSPRDALSRLETLVLMAGLELPSRAIREQIASAVDLIIHESRMPDGTRKVVSVAEITGMEGETITSQEIFVFRQTGFGPDGKVLGEMEATHAVPVFIHELRQRGIDVDMSIFG